RAETQRRSERLRRNERGADLHDAAFGHGPAATERDSPQHPGDQESYSLREFGRGKTSRPGSAPSGDGARRDELFARTDPAYYAGGGELRKTVFRPSVPGCICDLTDRPRDAAPAQREPNTDDREPTKVFLHARGEVGPP